METEFFEPCDNLSEFCVGKLARNTGCNNRKRLIVGIFFALFDNVNRVKDK